MSPNHQCNHKGNDRRDESFISFRNNAEKNANIICMISLLLLGVALSVHLLLVANGKIYYTYIPLELTFFYISIVLYVVPALICLIDHRTDKPFRKHMLLGAMIAGGTTMYAIIAKDGGVFILFPMFVAGLYYSEKTCLRTYIHLTVITILDVFLFSYLDIHFIHYYDLTWDLGELILNYLLPQLSYLTIVFLFSVYAMNGGRKFIRMLADMTEQDAKKKAEIETCVRVQQSTLPSGFDLTPGGEFSISARLEPAMETAGDFYDFFLTKDNHLVALVADVSDKGLAAALYTMSVRNTIRSLYRFPAQPESILTEANSILCETSDQEFVTMILVDLDIQTGIGKYVNAGHNPPFLLKTDGSAALIETEPQVFMGVFKGIRYVSGELSLGKGDILCMYTDGITEAADNAAEQYGIERLMQTAAAAVNSPLDDLSGKILTDVRAHADETVFFDDRTLVLLR